MNIQEMHSWFDVLQDKGDSPYFTIAEKTQFLNRAQTKFVNELMYKNIFTSGQQPEKNAVPYSSMESIQAGEDALEPLIFSLYSNANPIQNKYGSSVPWINKHSSISYKMLNDYCQYNVRSKHGASSRWAEAEILAILSVRYTRGSYNTVQFRYVRPSDVMKLKNNVFKKEENDDPIFHIKRDGYQMAPNKTPDGIINSDGGNGMWNPANCNGADYVDFDGTTHMSWSNSHASGSGIPNDSNNQGILGEVTLDIMVLRSPIPMNYDPIDSSANIDCELKSYVHDEIMSIALDDAGVASRDDMLMKLNAANKENLTPPV